MYDTEVLVSFTDADANRKQIVVDKFRQMKKQYGIWRMEV